MKYDLKKNLEDVDFYFDLRSETRDGFLSQLNFVVRSNSYVRILKENIDKKIIPGYKIYTNIEMILDCDEKETKYKLNVNFDKL